MDAGRRRATTRVGRSGASKLRGFRTSSASISPQTVSDRPGPEGIDNNFNVQREAGDVIHRLINGGSVFDFNAFPQEGIVFREKGDAANRSSRAANISGGERAGITVWDMGEIRDNAVRCDQCSRATFGSRGNHDDLG